MTPAEQKSKAFPPIGEELYEHYVSMSAQTHEALIKQYARAVLARAQADSQAPVVSIDENGVLFAACMVRHIDPKGTSKEVLDRIINWEIAIERDFATAAPQAVVAQPVDADTAAAQEFYACNPSAALMDLTKRLAQPVSAQLPAWFDTFLVNVCEIPDRNSPEGEPQAIVATLEELRNCALNAMDAPATPTPAVKYFVYSNEGGLNEYATDKERAAAHQEEIESHMDMHGEGWSDEVTTVISGIVTHETVKASSTPNPGHAGDCECEPCKEYADVGGTSEFSEICTYEAAPVAGTLSRG